jgi:hypothetical protein
VKSSNFTWSTGLRCVLQYLKEGWRLFNSALLRKWLWCYVHERKALWRVVVDSKYGSAWGCGVLIWFTWGGALEEY